MLIFISLCKN